MHSHYQVLVGEAVALPVSCWCRLSQPDEGTDPDQATCLKLFRSALTRSVPQNLGFAPEKKEEKLGNRELWWEESRTASCGSSPASSICYSSCNTSWLPAASSSVSYHPFLVHNFPSLALPFIGASLAKPKCYGLWGGEGLLCSEAGLLQHPQPGAWQHHLFPAVKPGRWFWQMWSSYMRNT